MEKEFSVYLKEYELKNAASYNGFVYAISLMKTLLNQSFESYIIGDAVRKIIAGENNNEFIIVTNAPSVVIEKCFYNEIKGDGSLIIEHGENIYQFKNFTSSSEDLKNGNIHFDKKLAATLQNQIFSCEALAVSPKCLLTDLFDGVNDIEKKVIRLVSKPHTLLKSSPLFLINAYVLKSKIGYSFDKKLKRTMKLNKKAFTKIPNYEMVKALKTILESPYQKETINQIYRLGVLSKYDPYNSFISRIVKCDNLSNFYKTMILYLLLNDIPDIDDLDVVSANEYREYISITRLLLDSEVTPMLVYNIGAKTLINADDVAKIFMKKYHSQKKKITKFEKHLVVNNIHEFKITPLEITTILSGDRSEKVKIIFNILLKKVINGELENNNVILKEEAKKVAKEIEEVFSNNISDVSNINSAEDLKALKERFDKDCKFLMDIYLNDSKEIYNMLPKERQKLTEEAYAHAKEFLSSTAKYQILESRGELND